MEPLAIATDLSTDAPAPSSRTQERFLEHLRGDPAGFDPAAYAELDRRDDFIRFPIQPWPLFLERARVEELARAGIAVSRLVKDVPRRVFANDPERIAEYYGLPREVAALVVDLAERTDCVQSAVARADLLWTAEGLKCCEVNVAGNLGGWQVGLWDRRYRQVPMVASFLDRAGPDLVLTDPLRSMLGWMIDEGRRRGFAEAGELNLALALPEVDSAAWRAFVDAEYRAVLGERDPALSGRAVVCPEAELVESGGRLHHLRADGPRIHLVLDALMAAAGRPLYLALAAGGALAFNGPVTGLLSDKRNLALLSELQDSDLFSAAEREEIRAYVPWTRRVAEEFVDYRGERVYLPDLLLAERERMVLKLGLSLAGLHVHVGRSTPAAEWPRRVEAALAEPGWVVQEHVESLPYLFLDPAGGPLPHDVAWGVFALGDRWGGAFLRMLPQGRDGVINAARGASEGLIYEVAE